MNEQPPGIGFGVVPRFVIAGALSTAYWLIPLKKDELHEGSLHVFTAILGSCFLGLVIVTALWLYGRMRSWRSAALLVGVMTIANGASVIAQYLPQRFQEDADLLLLTETILFYGACLIVFPVFALVLRQGSSAIRVLAVAFVAVGLAGCIFFYVVKSNRGGLINVLPGDPLGVVWQMVLTFFLALSLWIGHLVAPQTSEPGSALPRKRSGQDTVRNGLIALGILVGFGVLGQIWAKVVVTRSHDRETEREMRALEAINQSMAEAPSRENLPSIQVQPIEQILLPNVAGQEFWPKGQMLPPEDALPATESRFQRALRPQRYSYTAEYSIPGPRVEVVVYPNEAWARYEVRHASGPNTPILFPEHVWKISKYGNTIYQDAGRSYWPSGNKLVIVNTETSNTPILETFLRAYLQKYPSELH